MACVASLLSWATGPPVGAWQALVSASDAQASNADLDQLLGSSAALAAWAGLGWLSIALFLEVASALPGAAGRGFAAVAVRTSPMLVRRVVHALIGVSVLAGPLAAGSALAAGPSTNTSASPSPSASPSASTSVSVDRPSSLVAPSPSDPNPSDPNPSDPNPSDNSPAPPALDRPATAFVPSLPPPTTKQTPAGPAALITGVVHRTTADPSDPSTHGYVVRRGDTLWDIAARHLGPGATAVDISREWPAWYDANRAIIGSDPSVIRPGELLSPPPASTLSVGTR